MSSRGHGAPGPEVIPSRIAPSGQRLLDRLADTLPDTSIQIVVADLSTDQKIEALAATCAAEPLTLLINNAGVAYCMPLVDLPYDKARELAYVKTIAPLLLTRAALPGMLERGSGTVVNVAGLGMDLSGLPRMSADDVVTATLAGIALGEAVIAQASRTAVFCRPPPQPTSRRSKDSPRRDPASTAAHCHPGPPGQGVTSASLAGCDGHHTTFRGARGWHFTHVGGLRRLQWRS